MVPHCSCLPSPARLIHPSAGGASVVYLNAKGSASGAKLSTSLGARFEELVVLYP